MFCKVCYQFWTATIIHTFWKWQCRLNTSVFRNFPGQDSETTVLQQRAGSNKKQCTVKFCTTKDGRKLLPYIALKRKPLSKSV
jgi:hypothetical protein